MLYKYTEYCSVLKSTTVLKGANIILFLDGDSHSIAMLVKIICEYSRKIENSAEYKYSYYSHI